MITDWNRIIDSFSNIIRVSTQKVFEIKKTDIVWISDPWQIVITILLQSLASIICITVSTIIILKTSVGHLALIVKLSHVRNTVLRVIIINLILR